jgi:hypothetical protein
MNKKHIGVIGFGGGNCLEMYHFLLNIYSWLQMTHAKTVFNLRVCFCCAACIASERLYLVVCKNFWFWTSMHAELMALLIWNWCIHVAVRWLSIMMGLQVQSSGLASHRPRSLVLLLLSYRGRISLTKTKYPAEHEGEEQPPLYHSSRYDAISNSDRATSILDIHSQDMRRENLCYTYTSV